MFHCDIEQRMVSRVPSNLEHRVKGCGLFTPTLHQLSCHRVAVGQSIADFLTVNGEILGNGVIERIAVGVLAVQVLHVFYQLLAVGKELLARLLEILRRLYPCDVESLLHLLKEMGLRHFITMKFQTEWLKSHLRQTTLHHLKRCHLLCHEEYPFVMIQCVGNHIGDGLALSCSRRTVENETLAIATLDDCLKL